MVEWITIELKTQKFEKTIKNKEILLGLIETYYEASDKKYYDKTHLKWWIEKFEEMWDHIGKYTPEETNYIYRDIFDHIMCLAEFSRHTEDYITQKEGKDMFNQMNKLNPNFDKFTKLTTCYEY